MLRACVLVCLLASLTALNRLGVDNLNAHLKILRLKGLNFCFDICFQVNIIKQLSRQ